MRSISKLFYLIGVIFLIFAFFLYRQRTTPRRLEFKNYKSDEFTLNQDLFVPIAIIISDVDIELPIVPAKVSNSKWGATTKGVSYLSTTPIPGEMGNSILYGHNWKNLLGNLVGVQPGQIIKVVYSDGSTKNFIIKNTQIVNPTDASILTQTQDERITLYTCTGFLDNKRFVVTAVLSG